jgi:phosphoketolase
MSAIPHTNGGLVQKPLRIPEFRQYGVKVAKPGTTEVENTKPLGAFLRDVMRNNMTNFRVFGPDENTSNKLDAIYEASKKFWIAEYFPEDADGGELFANLHVRGYKEKGNINTPLKLAISNQIDRFSIAMDVIDRVPHLKVAGAHAKERFRNEQIACCHYAYTHGIDTKSELSGGPISQATERA